MLDRIGAFAVLAVALTSLARPAAAGTPFIDELYTYSRTRDIQYGSNVIGDGSTIPLLLDIYRPTGPNLPAELPGIVIMHGGYFESGSKSSRDAADLAAGFARRGYVAASIDYRLLDQRPPAPGAPVIYDPNRLPSWLTGQLSWWNATLDDYTNTIAAAVEDQAMAVNWLINNAAQFNMNPKMVAVGGFSAGAVSSLALGAGVVDGVNADIGAVMSLAGGLFGAEVNLGPDAAPAFMVHGTADTTVPFAELSFMAEAYRAAGVPYVAIEAPGVGHGVASLYGAGGEPRILTFMIEQLRAHAVPEPSSYALAAVGGVALLIARRRLSRRG